MGESGVLLVIYMYIIILYHACTAYLYKFICIWWNDNICDYIIKGNAYVTVTKIVETLHPTKQSFKCVFLPKNLKPGPLKCRLSVAASKTQHTVGRNPVPPVLYETLWKMGYSPYQLVSQISSINSRIIWCPSLLRHFSYFLHAAAGADCLEGTGLSSDCEWIP